MLAFCFGGICKHQTQQNAAFDQGLQGLLTDSVLLKFEYKWKKKHSTHLKSEMGSPYWWDQLKWLSKCAISTNVPWVCPSTVSFSSNVAKVTPLIHWNNYKKNTLLKSPHYPLQLAVAHIPLRCSDVVQIRILRYATSYLKLIMALIFISWHHYHHVSLFS